MKPAPPKGANPPPPAVPNLLAALHQLAGGDALDELVGRFVLNVTETSFARGSSTTWEGARRVAEALAGKGCDVVLRLGVGTCLCRVSRPAGKDRPARELATVEAASLPEALARAALLSCLAAPPTTP